MFFGLAHGKIDFAGKCVGFEEYKSIVGFEHWAALEGEISTAPRGGWLIRSKFKRSRLRP